MEPRSIPTPVPGTTNDMPPAKRLRLSAILEDLHQNAAVIEDSTRGGAAASSPARLVGSGATAESEAGEADASRTPWRLRRKPRKPKIRTNITVGEIMDRAAHAGFGFVFALLAIAAMPLPGFSMPFGLAIALGALQLMVGQSKPWMPREVRNHAITMSTLQWMSKTLTRWTRGLEHITKPRFEVMTRGLMWSLCGLGVFLLGIGLSLPLVVPFSNVVFVIPLLVYSIGMLESDGILIALGHALVGIELALAVWFGDFIWEKSQSVLSYFF